MPYGIPFAIIQKEEKLTPILNFREIKNEDINVYYFIIDIKPNG